MAVWAESDQVTGVCEGALAVVSVPSDRIGHAFEIVLVAWVRGIGAGAILEVNTSRTVQI